MNDNQGTQTETHRIEHYEDEIELIDILRVIWKWKHFILAGTVICGLIAAIISLNMRKVYSIDMIFRLGILKIGEQGKNVYIDSSENIKALIDSGTLNNDILNYLNEIKMENIPKKLAFKVTIPVNSNMIKVEYKTDDIKQGMVIQNRLSKLLLEKYSNMVKYYKNEYDIKLKSLKSESEYIKGTIQYHKRSVKNIEKRIDELMPEIELIKNNTANLIKERDKLLSRNSKENNILSVLVYNNIIQENLELLNNYQNDINDYKQEKEDGLQKIEKFENEIAQKLNEIENYQFQKINIQNMQIIQSPTRSPFPIIPKTWLFVMIALLTGLFLMLFLAFFWEYLSKYKNKEG